MSFDTLGLTPELLRAVAAEGYTEPTPVQAEAIPHVLARRDVLAGAQTGTGKTAAFVLPILQLLHENRPTPRHPIRESRPRGRRSFGVRPKIASGLPIRCLVLTPTRELALQVEEFVQNYGREQPVRSTTIYGGVGYDAQFKAIAAGPEIVVATPGRLLDIQEQGKIDLRSVEILVLDEADRMLDMGFIRDIRKIIGAAAGHAPEPDVLGDVRGRRPRARRHHPPRSGPGPDRAPQRRRSSWSGRSSSPSTARRKRELLSHLIRSGRIDRALVFTRTKHGASRLAEQLERDGITAGAIHGNKTPGPAHPRARRLQGRPGRHPRRHRGRRARARHRRPAPRRQLRAADRAQDYVHRIGRTGRAGMEGDAVSLVCIDELELLHDIERLLRDADPARVRCRLRARSGHPRRADPRGPRQPRRPRAQPGATSGWPTQSRPRCC